MRNSDSEKGLSLLTLGLEKDLGTPISSSRFSMVAARNSAQRLRLGVAVVGMQDQGLGAQYQRQSGGLPVQPHPRAQFFGS
jgi:hypothetical protein